MSLDWQTIYMLEVDFPSGKYEQKNDRKFPVALDSNHVWQTTDATKIILRSVDPSYPTIEMDIPAGAKPFYKRFTGMIGKEIEGIVFFVGYELRGIKTMKMINTKKKTVHDKKDKAWPH